MSVLPCFLSLLQKQLPIKLRQNDVKYSYNVCNILKMLKHNVGRAVRVTPLCFNMWHVELSFLTQSLFPASPSLALFLAIPFLEFTLWSPSPHVLIRAGPWARRPIWAPVLLTPTSVSSLPRTILFVTCQSPLFNNESLGGRDLSLFTSYTAGQLHNCPVCRG